MVAPLLALVFGPGVLADTMPEGVDANLAAYYDRAAAAASAGELQRALAMFELLLIPPKTEVVIDPSGAGPELVRGVERGFAMWRDVLGNDFPFVVVSAASTKKPMQVRFTSGLGGKANHKGEITTTRRVRWSKTDRAGEFESSISIVIWATDKRYMTEAEVAHVVGHELGHALGLDDVQRADRIMGPVLLGDPYARVFPAEGDSVRAFRTMVRRQIARLNAAGAWSPEPAAQVHNEPHAICQAH